MIVEIIFSDYYRTFLLCILSMGVTFFIRKFSVKEGVLALVMYEFIMLIPFVWILIVSVSSYGLSLQMELIGISNMLEIRSAVSKRTAVSLCIME